MTPWVETIALWSADFYLAATILLFFACPALCLIKQPARRIAFSWGTLLGLLVAATLCQLAARPRVDPRRLFARQEQPTVRVETTQPRADEPTVSETTSARQPAAAPQPPSRELPEPMAGESSGVALNPPPVDVASEPETAIEQPSGWNLDSQTIAGCAVLLLLTGAALMAGRLAIGAWRSAPGKRRDWSNRVSRLLAHWLTSCERLSAEKLDRLGCG
jgi:apolipoprotein N-acyltransferase